MEFLLALFIKVIETVLIAITKDLINHVKEQRKKTTLTPQKRNKGGNSKK